MVRSLEMTVRCDLCGRLATHVDVSIQIGARRRRSIDLCTADYEQLVRPLTDVLELYGYDPNRPTTPRTRQSHHRAIGPYLCQAGCRAAPLKNSTTFTQHLLRVHDGMTMAAYVDQYGELVALTPEELEALDVEIVCPEGCGQVYSLSRGNRYPQNAMHSHMWGHHGIKWRTTADA